MCVEQLSLLAKNILPNEGVEFEPDWLPLVDRLNVNFLTEQFVGNSSFGGGERTWAHCGGLAANHQVWLCLAWAFSFQEGEGGKSSTLPTFEIFELCPLFSQVHKRWLRFLPFWASARSVQPRFPVQSAPSGSSPPASPAAPHRACLPCTNVGGRLQLCPFQQFRPVIPPHAQIHKWPSSPLNQADAICSSAGSVKEDLAKSKPKVAEKRTCILANAIGVAALALQIPCVCVLWFQRWVINNDRRRTNRRQKVWEKYCLKRWASVLKRWRTSNVPQMREFWASGPSCARPRTAARRLGRVPTVPPHPFINDTPRRHDSVKQSSSQPVLKRF